MRALLVCSVFLLVFVGCGDSSSCLPDLPGMTPCPDGVFIDASTTDPICLSGGGEPLCRGKESADCYICTGADFTDNCTLASPQQTTECVHSCAKC